MPSDPSHPEPSAQAEEHDESGAVESATAPCWARDPYGHSALRWFDGNAWTHYVATDGTVATDAETDLARPEAPPPAPPSFIPLPLPDLGKLWALIIVAVAATAYGAYSIHGLATANDETFSTVYPYFVLWSLDLGVASIPYPLILSFLWIPGLVLTARATTRVRQVRTHPVAAPGFPALERRARRIYSAAIGCAIVSLAATGSTLIIGHITFFGTRLFDGLVIY